MITMVVIIISTLIGLHCLKTMSDAGLQGAIHGLAAYDQISDLLLFLLHRGRDRDRGRDRGRGRGRWCTLLMVSFLHQTLSSTLLIAATPSSGIHFVASSVNSLLGLPLLLLPSTFPCKTVFINVPLVLTTCPCHFSSLIFTMFNRLFSLPFLFLISYLTNSFVFFSFHEIINTLLKHLMSKASVLFVIFAFRVQVSHP